MLLPKYNKHILDLNMTKKKQLVVIGNGMVGHKFLQSMTQSDSMQEYQITTFCEESRLAYDRVQLSAYFSGKTEEDLSLVEPDFFKNNNITEHQSLTVKVK